MKSLDFFDDQDAVISQTSYFYDCIGRQIAVQLSNSLHFPDRTLECNLYFTYISLVGFDRQVYFPGCSNGIFHRNVTTSGHFRSEIKERRDDEHDYYTEY